METKNQSYDYFHEYTTTSTQISNKSNELQLDKSIYLYIKRLIDISSSLLGMALSFPIVLLFIILIKLETRGPAFFMQERVGLNGKYFYIIKLRSMKMDAEKNGAQWAEINDTRITKIGHIIRKTRIDELPQLLNIFMGDMSLVGPRPERPIFTAKFNEEIPGFITRLQVKPGLTGWAQINGGYDISPAEKLRFDSFYINNMNFIFDLKIIFKTAVVCLTGNGAR